MGYSVAWGKLIHEKTWNRKSGLIVVNAIHYTLNSLQLKKKKSAAPNFLVNTLILVSSFFYWPRYSWRIIESAWRATVHLRTFENSNAFSKANYSDDCDLWSTRDERFLGDRIGYNSLQRTSNARLPPPPTPTSPSWRQK